MINSEFKIISNDVKIDLRMDICQENKYSMDEFKHQTSRNFPLTISDKKLTCFKSSPLSIKDGKIISPQYELERLDRFVGNDFISVSADDYNCTALRSNGTSIPFFLLLFWNSYNEPIATHKW